MVIAIRNYSFALQSIAVCKRDNFLSSSLSVAHPFNNVLKRRVFAAYQCNKRSSHITLSFYNG